MLNKWKPYGRVLLEADGVGTPASSSSDESSDILDVFKMDFGGTEADSTGNSSSETGQSAEVTPSKSVSSEAEPGQDAVDPAQSGPIKEPESAPEVPSEPATPQPKSPTAEELLAQAMEVNKRLSEQLSMQQPKASQRPSQPEEDEDTKVFSPRKYEDYAFNINPQLYEGLFSAEATQEQRIQCLQAYASGIATTVHNNILKTLGSWVKQNFEAVPGVIQYMIGQTNQTTQATNQIRESFYSTYPDLKRPELFPLLKATIQSVQKETGAKAWDTAFANKVATRVRSILSSYAQASKPKPAAPAMTPAAAKPAPQVVEKDPNGMDEIIATFQDNF